MTAETIVGQAGAMSPVALLRALDGWLAETGHDDGHPWRVSIAQTLKAQPDSGAWMGAGFGDLKRLELAYRAAAEIDACQRMLRREASANSDDPTELMLVLSCNLRRIGTMANAVMGALNDGAVTTEELAADVIDSEVHHG